MSSQDPMQWDAGEEGFAVFYDQLQTAAKGLRTDIVQSKLSLEALYRADAPENLPTSEVEKAIGTAEWQLEVLIRRREVLLEYLATLPTPPKAPLSRQQRRQKS